MYCRYQGIDGVFLLGCLFLLGSFFSIGCCPGLASPTGEIPGTPINTDLTITPVLLSAQDTKRNISSDLYCVNIPKIIPSTVGSSADNIAFSRLQQFAKHWEKLGRNSLGEYSTTHTIWCRVFLQNTSKNYQWFLVLDNTRLDFVNFYWVDQGASSPSQQAQAGDNRLISPASASAYPTFHFTLPPQQSGTLYFAVDTDSATWMRPFLYSSTAYGESMSQRHFWQWIYGLLIALVILLQVFLTRKVFGAMDIWYVLSLLSGLLYLYGFFGDANLWLWQESGKLKKTLLFLFNLSYQFFVLHFLKEYLRTAEFSPRLHRFYNLHSLLIIILTIAILFFPFSNINLVKLTALAAFMTAVLTLVGTVGTLRRGQIWASGLAISWSSIAMCAIIFTLVFLNILPYSKFTEQAFLWVFPCDVIMLSLSFVYRNYQIKRELAQLQDFINNQHPYSPQPHTTQTTFEQENRQLIPVEPVENAKRQLARKPGKEASQEKRIKGIDTEVKIQQLIDCFEIKKLYLDENLTLTRVAERLQLRSDQISAMVNQELGTSFSTLINEYRVREAKKLIQEKPEETLLNIAVASGFNSRTNFNRVFKIHAQITPIAYRKKCNATATLGQPHSHQRRLSP